MMLKDIKLHITGWCARCRFPEICGGNLRVRAEADAGIPWEPAPACSPTDKEIGIE
ncbi:MAG: hypothetical protein ACYC9O_05585 [Candidatus Latescibacterota bacterium]